MEHWVGKELRMVSNMAMRYVEQYTNKKRVDAITGANGWILGFIAARDRQGRPVFQRDLEKEFGVTRSTASKVVNLMVQKGLIERQSVPSDARLKQLILTAKSAEIMNIMWEDHKRVEKALTRGFAPDEIACLLGYLERIKANLAEDSGQTTEGSVQA